MRLDNIELIIIEELYKSSKLRLSGYSIFKKANTTIKDFNDAILKLIEKKFIEEVEVLTYKLTNSAKEWLLSKKNKKISLNNDWKKIPSEFKTNYKLEPNQFYIPNIKLLKD